MNGKQCPFVELIAHCFIDASIVGYVVSLILNNLTCHGCPMLQPPTNSTFCTQPSAQGDCRAYIPSFFYNSESGVCEDFVYGGCGGNLNNFPTLEDCAEAAVEYCGADPEKVVTSRARATISGALSVIFVAMALSLALRQ